MPNADKRPHSDSTRNPPVSSFQVELASWCEFHRSKHAAIHHNKPTVVVGQKVARRDPTHLPYRQRTLHRLLGCTTSPVAGASTRFFEGPSRPPSQLVFVSGARVFIQRSFDTIGYKPLANTFDTGATDVHGCHNLRI